MSSLAQRIVFGAPFAFATLALAACGGISRSGPVADQALPNTPALEQARVVAPLPDQARIVAPLLEPVVPKITGSYAGTLTITADGRHLTGTLTIDVKQQKGKRISGTFDGQVDSQTENLNFTGTAMRGKAGAARVKLKITAPSGRLHRKRDRHRHEGGRLQREGLGSVLRQHPHVHVHIQNAKIIVAHEARD